MQMTLQELSPKSFQKLTATASDFHARLSALLESEEASKIQEELCFLKSCGWLESESLVYFSPKTSEVSSTMRGDKRSESSYPQWMSWGTMSNGRCLTANILGFPRIGQECSLLDILEKQVDEKYFLSDATMEHLIRNDWKPSREFRHLQQRATKESQNSGTAQDRQGVMVREATCKQVIGGSQGNRVYDPSGISVTLSSQGGGRGAKTGLYAVIQRPRGYNKGGMHNEAPTLTGNSWQQNNFATDGIRIRRLTPRECFRLQGFPDEYFDRAAAVNSDSQLYKQAGNSVTVNVVYEIAKRLEA